MKWYKKQNNFYYILIFYGEYLNGKKWNGQRYNYKSDLEFELKDVKGNIKEYNFYGVLIFEGEYLNGKRNGKGKEYHYYNGEIIFEREYLNGNRNWKGKQYEGSKLTFEGENLNGKKMER